MQKPVLHVLLIEDNLNDAELMIVELKRGNKFFVNYAVVDDEKGMRAALEKKSWNIVLCDYNLPSFSAEKALQILKDLELNTPFVLVSGVISQDIANRMVRQGASDYITKELMARVIPVIDRELELSSRDEQLLTVLSLALEYKDWNTQGHSRRVTDLTVQLARKMGVNEVDVVHIRRGALLHDIGKIGVPDSILLKPGKLTPAERTQMEMHPQLAYDLLSPVPFLGRALDVPYCHHERWNGTGYPRQLEGEQIPLSARIFAVIDTFDALTSNRPYRNAMSTEEALDYIREQSGVLFDPKVVETFSKMMESE